MAQKLDDKELVDIKEMIMAHSIQVDALCQLLIEKRIITEEEFFSELKRVQKDYQMKKAEI